MTKDLNVFDKHYGLLINGEWTDGRMVQKATP